MLHGDIYLRTTSTVLANISLSRSLWIPNVLIVNVKSFKTMSGLEDETGLFIRDSGPGKPMDVLYIQLAEVTILCPMR